MEKGKSQQVNAIYDILIQHGDISRNVKKLGDSINIAFSTPNIERRNKLLEKTAEDVHEFGNLFSKHVNAETSILFSAILRSDPDIATIRTVLKLEREHGLFIMLIEQMERKCRNHRSSDEIEFIRQSIIKLIKEHDPAEVHQLYPLVNESQRIQDEIGLIVRQNL